MDTNNTNKLFVVKVEGEDIPTKRRRAARCVAALLVGDSLLQQEVAMLLGLEGPLHYAHQGGQEIDLLVATPELNPQFVEL